MAQAVPASPADRRFLTARSAALLGCGTLVVLFALAVPAQYERLVELRDLPTGIDAGELRANLADSRMTTGFWAGYQLALQISFALVCVLLAVALVWRRSAHRLVPLVAVLVVLIGTTFWNTIGALGHYDPALGVVGEVLGAGAKCALLAILLVFPDGRFVPAWTRYVAVALGVGVLAEVVLHDNPYVVSNWPVPLFLLLIAGLLAVGVFAQVHRYRHVSGPAERQQTKWVVAGVVAAIAGFLGVILVAEVWLSLADPGTPGELVAMTLITAALLLVPVSISIAVQRHHLYEIDLIINRAVVYGVLSAGVVGLYVLVVVSLGSVVGTSGDLAASLVAAGLVAVLFAPVREVVQRGVNHLMYGKRDDPYVVLTRLGERLEATTTGTDVLPVAVAAVADALKLPYVALEVDRPHGVETVAAAGTALGDPLVLPLSYGGESVGRLVLGPRAGESGVAAADRRVLGDLVRPLGAAVHAASLAEEASVLSHDLQRSRERLVSTREEERRRLRRDLHDGLGPQLASLTMQAEAARELIGPQPERATEVLGDLVRLAQDAVADVRRVVDALRPPALDALGLVGALRAAVTLQEAGGMRVDLAAAEPLPPLPAAVEVAAYRLVTEAVTNAARHSGGTTCRVRLEPVAGALEVEVTDDGCGVSEAVDGGVGLGSMRERAEELGGSFTLERAPSGGTRVLARLPFRETP